MSETTVAHPYMSNTAADTRAALLEGTGASDVKNCSSRSRLTIACRGRWISQPS